MTADSWHTEKSYLKSGWYKPGSYTGMLTNFRRLPNPRPLPTMNSLTYAEITPRPYSAEASRGHLKPDTEDMLRKSARVYPVPVTIQTPENRVLDHYAKARARQEYTDFKRMENLKIKKERDNQIRKRESERKKKREDRKSRGEDDEVASDDSSDYSNSSLGNVPYLPDSDQELSEDELPDAFFESFQDESRLTKALDNLPQLDRLHLAGHNWLSEAFICDIGLKYTSLRSLNLCACAVTDEAAARIAQNCRQLHLLDLSLCKGLTMLDLTGLVGLQELKLSRLPSVVTSEFVASLRPMRKLKTVDFSFASQLGDIGLQELAEGSRALTWVDLSNCPRISGAGVLAIARKNPNIRHLFLMLNDQSSLSDDDMAQVSKHLKRLQVLDVSACSQLGRLTLAGVARHCQFVEKISLASLVQIGNDEVRSLLSKCLSLSYIDLSSCALLTPEALFDIGGAKNLKKVLLSMTPNISDDYLSNLRQKHPNVQIVRYSRVQEHPEDLSLALRCPPKPIKKGKKKKRGVAKAKAKK